MELIPLIPKSTQIYLKISKIVGMNDIDFSTTWVSVTGWKDGIRYVIVPFIVNMNYSVCHRIQQSAHHIRQTMLYIKSSHRLAPFKVHWKIRQHNWDECLEPKWTQQDKSFYNSPI